MNNRIVDARPLCEALKTNCTLKSLLLHNNLIANEGDIAEIVRCAKSLMYVILSESRLDAVTNIIKALVVNKSLYHLNLDRNLITPEKMKQFNVPILLYLRTVVPRGCKGEGFI